MSYVGTLNLVVTHKNYPALAQATFELPEHHLTLVTGDNGSGKTTLLKAIAGLIRPARGMLEVKTNGVVHEDSYELRRNVSYVGHNLFYMRHIRVKEHLELSAKLDNNLGDTSYAMSKEEALERFDLKNRADTRLENLSAGQQRRLALASAFIRKAQMLCVDEPHASLDSNSQQLIDDLITEQYNAGRSFIIATHHPQRLEDISTHHLTIDSGVCVLGEV